MKSESSFLESHSNSCLLLAKRHSQLRWQCVKLFVCLFMFYDVIPLGLFNFKFSLHSHINVYIIIFILSYHQQGYLWPSLATPPNRSSLPAGPQGCIPYPHRAAVCKFELVALLLLGHVKGSIGVLHLWSHPYFSSMSDIYMTWIRIVCR